MSSKKKNIRQSKGQKQKSPENKSAKDRNIAPKKALKSAKDTKRLMQKKPFNAKDHTKISSGPKVAIQPPAEDLAKAVLTEKIAEEAPQKADETLSEQDVPHLPDAIEAPDITPPVMELLEPAPEPETAEKSGIIIGNSDDQDDKNKVEALLFACGKYIEDQLIGELCGIDKRKLKRVLEELRKDYELKNNALMIFNEGNSWKINVREKYLSIVRKIVADTELPRSVMETLAVIAWKSPIFQSEVVRIRGNKCYDHIDVLEESGFISKDKKGRSYVLKATDKFYNYFEIDHGNLKGVFDSVKVPEIREEQKTLAADIIAEDEKDKISAIELRKWTETEEEKQGHRQFLEQIEHKIQEVKEKNKLLAEEIPRPALEKPIEQPQIIQESLPETQTADINPETIPNVDVQVASQETVQPQAEIHPHKPKSLTKKQLEKKFKDDLIRVREKMEKKNK